MKLNPLKWFKKEEELKYPSHFFLIRLNPIAKSLGIKDTFNKEIDEIKNGVVINTFPYSDKLLSSIKELDEVPLFEEDFDEDEEYEYDSFSELGVIKYKK